jgi:RNA polymerase sigma-70 factor (ECF subfamily)
MVDSQALFAAHQDGLLRYLTRAVGHRETAQDLTQDVFVRISSSATLPPSAEQQRAWVFRIARNLVIDHHRRQQHRHTESLPVDPVGHSAVAAADTAAIVHQALSRLDDEARDVFLMREVGGLSYVEIAEACQLTPDAVRSRIHRTRLQLRAQLSAPIAAARTGALRLHPTPTQTGTKA